MEATLGGKVKGDPRAATGRRWNQTETKTRIYVTDTVHTEVKEQSWKKSWRHDVCEELRNLGLDRGKTRSIRLNNMRLLCRLSLYIVYFFTIFYDVI